MTDSQAAGSEAASVTTLNGRSEADVRASVRDVIRELAPGAEGEPTQEAKLVDELGYHSLALLELAFTLEDEFDLEPIDEQTARKIVTVRDVEDHVVRELGARAAAKA